MEMDHSKPASRAAVDDAAAGGLSVRLNGEPRLTRAPTLAALIAEAGYGDARIATAVNGEFVPARARAAMLLSAGDSIEIVAPRQGG